MGKWKDRYNELDDDYADLARAADTQYTTMKAREAELLRQLEEARQAKQKLSSDFQEKCISYKELFTLLRAKEKELAQMRSAINDYTEYSFLEGTSDEEATT